MNTLKSITDVFCKLPFKHSDDANSSKSSSYGYTRNAQNFILIWLDASSDKINNSDCRNTILKLQKIVNTINTFTDINQCLTFITNIKDEKVFMIISGSYGEIILPRVHDMIQIDSIYIFCRNDLKHKQWSKNWLKIQGVYTKILPICEELKHAAQQCDQNTIPISFISINEQSSNQSLDQINQSFIYTQILKEILLKIEFERQSLHDFILYCRQQFIDNSIELDNINKFEYEYDKHKSIWWYTCECFLYSMLNRALRMMEIDIIIKMGFFIRNLHENIEKLHFEQYRNHRYLFTVYRGQGLMKQDFEQLQKTKGGLLSFNNFLSTSKKQTIALNFVRRSILNSQLIGVLFVMTIDTSLASTPFASIKDVSYSEAEREILFSMHSIFRIGSIRRIDHDNDRLWQVELKLTSDNDPQRLALAELIRNEIPGLTGWHRLGQFLIMMEEFIKAEDVYKVLLNKPHEKDEEAQFYHHLGVIKDKKGQYEMALQFYEKSLEINSEILVEEHHFLASSYTGIGSVYSKLGDYSKALSSHEKALEIFQKTLSPNHPLIAKSYGNIGKVYNDMGEYSKALLYHEIALTIFHKIPLRTHPSMAICYYDIGNVYEKIGEFSKALSSYEKALKIRLKILPPNHPLLAASYNTVGELYAKMSDYSNSKELSCIQHTSDLSQGTISLHSYQTLI